jgi:hypothetical protein
VGGWCVCDQPRDTLLALVGMVLSNTGMGSATAVNAGRDLMW